MLVPYNFVPRGWIECDGAEKKIDSHTVLFSIIGTNYGGNGTSTFKMPDLRGRVPIHQNEVERLGNKGGTDAVTLDFDTAPSHTHPVHAVTSPADQSTPTGHILAAAAPRGINAYTPLGSNPVVGTAEHVTTRTGGGDAHENRQPSLGLRYVIANSGLYPSRGTAEGEEASSEDAKMAAMAEPNPDAANAPGDATEAYLGEIRLLPYNFAPRNWAECKGQLLPIKDYKTLFSLLGTTFGGDGRTTFGLPDLRGRVAMGLGAHGGTTYVMGQKVGAESVALKTNEIPSHDHDLTLANADPETGDPTGNMLAARTNIYGGGPPQDDFATTSIGNNAPGGEAHPNMMPFLTLQYGICLSGIFPSRN